MTGSSGLILSMTGFGVASSELTCGALSLEVKSVNSRFLDISFRMNDEMRALEPILREQIAATVSRGKIELRITTQRE